MIPPLPPLKVTLLEKAAADNGFDLPLARDANWLGFAKTHAPMKLFLLGLAAPLKVRTLCKSHRSYLPWHRERVFKGS
jgi:hypothetical protein